MFAVLVLGIVGCLALYALVDILLDGIFLDWIDRNFMLEYYEYSWQLDQDVLVKRPAWGKIKATVLMIFILSVLFWLSIVMAVSYFHGKRKSREAVTEAGNIIHHVLGSEKRPEKLSSEVIPAEYAEIFAEVSQIKSEMLYKEQILKEESARKNDLIAYLAHDLKTPLTSVIGYLSLLEEAPDMPAEQKAKYLHISLEKALRLEKLINEFFEITRYNLQNIYLEKESIDLSYMLIQMADEFYPVLKSHGNSIEISVEEDLTVVADSLKLARVFNNILKNAIAYSYPDTAIHITAGSTEDEVWIAFQNRGKTIPEQKLHTIFEKFFRLDDARATNTGGAGLGLAIAKEIVNLHGGKIEAESRNEKTSFTVRLPL